MKDWMGFVVRGRSIAVGRALGWCRVLVVWDVVRYGYEWLSLRGNAEWMDTENEQLLSSTGKEAFPIVERLAVEGEDVGVFKGIYIDVKCNGMWEGVACALVPRVR